jgi:hypothetical protein
MASPQQEEVMRCVHGALQLRERYVIATPYALVDPLIVRIVYDPAMPEQIPFHYIIRRFLQQSFFATLFLLRAAFVSFIWLCFLPWMTLWTWRMYFVMGEST